MAAFMQYGNVPTPHCIFESCFKLKPGHFFEVSLASEKLMYRVSPKDQIQYWNVYDAYNKPKLDMSFEEAKKANRKES